jgi:Helix-turn-helix domain
VRREAYDARLGDYWVQYEPANLVDWGEFRVPEMFTAGFPKEPLRVLIEVVLDYDDGPKCVAISCLDHDAPALTSERRFPLQAMVSAAVRAAAFEFVDVPVEQVDPDGTNTTLVPDERGHVQVYAPAFDEQGNARWGDAPQGPAGGRDLARVAALYRRAVAAGSPPSAAIASEFGITRSTARKWVQRARARGLLGPAVGRRVGEAARVPPAGTE